ncbi:hypothetical protein DPEC_G00023740 [Dallia pectoralis]|uniref:Uncharacterized protein n=1 Tax=Dallia pectoralis TaxID=75939 RepID=A0ACC2HHH7_DALPE|nr:hypothetical protein DPEC_G00023740 [Dallia pectoralis]
MTLALLPELTAGLRVNTGTETASMSQLFCVETRGTSAHLHTLLLASLFVLLTLHRPPTLTTTAASTTEHYRIAVTPPAPDGRSAACLNALFPCGPQGA